MSANSERIAMRKHDKAVTAYCRNKQKELRILAKYLIQDFDTPQAERHLRAIAQLLQDVKYSMCG
jgi:hypothetical protein